MASLSSSASVVDLPGESTVVAVVFGVVTDWGEEASVAVVLSVLRNQEVAHDQLLVQLDPDDGAVALDPDVVVVEEGGVSSWLLLLFDGLLDQDFQFHDRVDDQLLDWPPLLVELDGVVDPGGVEDVDVVLLLEVVPVPGFDEVPVPGVEAWLLTVQDEVEPVGAVAVQVDWLFDD